MNEQLHEAFVNRMREQLGSELTAFLHALEEPPLRGIRLNPLKPTQFADKYRKKPVAWFPDSYYLDADSDAGATVLHEAGAFYIQEPGAMMPAAVLTDITSAPRAGRVQATTLPRAPDRP